MAKGNALVYAGQEGGAVPRYGIRQDQVPAEQHRLSEAIEKSCEELHAVRERMLRELGQAEAEIFATHVALLRDRQFVHNVQDRISRDRVNVEQALDAEIADLSRLLEDMENEFFHDRAHDVHDVGRRVLRHLGHRSQDELAKLPPQTILVARQLAPSDTLNLDRRNVVGIVTERGGSTSHTAILARSLGIPAVSNIETAAAIHTGDCLLVDGQTGTVCIAACSDEACRTIEVWQHEHQAPEPAAGPAECRTADGCRIHIYANIDRPEESYDVLHHGLEGVGLFRTEYLFLRASQPPGLDEQREVYSRVLEAMGSLPVVIRTMDLGGDKMPMFRLTSQNGANCRGLKFSLLEGELLRTQLRAALSGMGQRRLALLFPMVLGGCDMAQALRELDTVGRDLGLSRRPCVGAMVETPSALFELREILDQVDWVSIGTNDLVQFMLATDRMAADALGEEALFQPAILRAIERVVREANRRAKPVCVCGEAASRPDIACLLVGLGVENLSMCPIRAAAVRQEIARHRIDDLRHLADHALKSRSAVEVAELMQGMGNLK